MAFPFWFGHLQGYQDSLPFYTIFVIPSPIGEVIAAHIQQASTAHKDKSWREKATHEVITLLRDDYPTLMSVLGALSDVNI